MGSSFQTLGIFSYFRTDLESVVEGFLRSQGPVPTWGVPTYLACPFQSGVTRPKAGSPVPKRGHPSVRGFAVRVTWEEGGWPFKGCSSQDGAAQDGAAPRSVQLVGGAASRTVQLPGRSSSSAVQHPGRCSSSAVQHLRRYRSSEAPRTVQRPCSQKTPSPSPFVTMLVTTPPSPT